MTLPVAEGMRASRRRRASRALVLLSAVLTLLALYVLGTSVANSSYDPQENRDPGVVIGAAALSLASGALALRSTVRAHGNPTAPIARVMAWLALTTILILFTIVAALASGPH